MCDRLVSDLRARLRGRSKRDLIEGMIARSPHEPATSRMIEALEVYPLVLLMLAHDYPTRVWLLDKGEKVSSAKILTKRMLRRRWHSAAIGVDDCEGLTDVAPGYLAIVTGWRTPLLMRHEFAHAVTTFFSAATRRWLCHLYHEACLSGRFAEPLARESIGEYVACGLSYYFSPDLSAELRSVDPRLYDVIDRFVGEAEHISSRVLAAEARGPVGRSAIV